MRSTKIKEPEVKKEIFVNTLLAKKLDNRPNKKERAVCPQCKGSIKISNIGKGKFTYSGTGFFCSKQCAIIYANEAVMIAAGMPPFNEHSL